jgi:hypothetical protein
VSRPAALKCRRLGDGTSARGADRGATNPRLDTMAPDDEEYSGFNDTRQKRIKVVAWVTIVALILVGGGATVFALLFG